MIAQRPITIAILAMGGEGGGVLADWIVDMAEHAGYVAQKTSVPGVAQRTGATIYYLELLPEKLAIAAGRDPVLALMPVPGEVDIVIASELMEAGRAVQRGFVSPDRTTLIASAHRVYAMTEKITLDDGRVNSVALVDACAEAAKRFILADMAALAEASHAMISATLFGALAGAEALPFMRPEFEAAIKRGGVGVGSSLAGFEAGYAVARNGEVLVPMAGEPAHNSAPAVAALLRTLPAPSLPDATRFVLEVAIERLIDYQGADYARLYLSRLTPVIALEAAYGDGRGTLLLESARQLALGMTYEDTIRVAALKIRAARFERVRDEVQARDGQIVEIAEFLHPRLQEIAETVPASLGRFLLRNSLARRLVEAMTRKGKIVKTTSLHGFLMLYAIASLRPLRPKSMRYASEQDMLEKWLAKIRDVASRDYALACEIVACRGLLRGYGDTHDRGHERFASLMQVSEKIEGSAEAAAIMSRLHKAALKDESGDALAIAIAEELSPKRAPDTH